MKFFKKRAFFKKKPKTPSPVVAGNTNSKQLSHEISSSWLQLDLPTSSLDIHVDDSHLDATVTEKLSPSSSLSLSFRSSYRSCNEIIEAVEVVPTANIPVISTATDTSVSLTTHDDNRSFKSICDDITEESEETYQQKDFTEVSTQDDSYLQATVVAVEVIEEEENCKENDLQIDTTGLVDITGNSQNKKNTEVKEEERDEQEPGIEEETVIEEDLAVGAMPDKPDDYECIIDIDDIVKSTQDLVIDDQLTHNNELATAEDNNVMREEEEKKRPEVLAETHDELPETQTIEASDHLLDKHQQDVHANQPAPTHPKISKVPISLIPRKLLTVAVEEPQKSCLTTKEKRTSGIPVPLKATNISEKSTVGTSAYTWSASSSDSYIEKQSVSSESISSSDSSGNSSQYHNALLRKNKRDITISTTSISQYSKIPKASIAVFAGASSPIVDISKAVLAPPPSTHRNHHNSRLPTKKSSTTAQTN